MPKDKPVKIVWSISNANINVASYRYRVLLPITLLASEKQIQHIVISGSDEPDWFSGIDVMIMIKPQRRIDVLWARRANAMGIKVIVDLCDDIFFWPQYYLAKGDQERYLVSKNLQDNFGSVLEYASHVTVTGEILAERVRSVLRNSIPISIVQDIHPLQTVIENSFAVGRFERKIWYYFGRSPGWWLYRTLPFLILKLPLKMLCRAFKETCRLLDITFSTCINFWEQGFTKIFAVHKTKWNPKPGSAPAQFSHPGAIASNDKIDSSDGPIVLWLGNAGVFGVYGMSDLLEISAALKNVKAKTQFTLVICSSDELQFQSLKAHLPPDTKFVKWSASSADGLLEKAKMLIIPKQSNAFSESKSPNRALLAIARGLAVVASPVPSYGPLAAIICTNDWEKDIHLILTGDRERERRVDSARQVAAKVFSELHVKSAWTEILKTEN